LDALTCVCVLSNVRGAVLSPPNSRALYFSGWLSHLSSTMVEVDGLGHGEPDEDVAAGRSPSSPQSPPRPLAAFALGSTREAERHVVPTRPEPRWEDFGPQ
jgi:hypothetical protein